MLYAFWNMYRVSENNIERTDTKYKKSGRVYQKLKEEMSQTNSGEKNPMYGRTHFSVWVDKYGLEEAERREQERREKISGEKNVMYGRKHSPEVREKMSGKKNPMYSRTHSSIWLEKYGPEEAERRQQEMIEKRKQTWKNKKGDIT